MREREWKMEISMEVGSWMIEVRDERVDISNQKIENRRRKINKE